MGWTREGGRSCLSDEQMSGRPSEGTTEEYIENIRATVEVDHKITTRQLSMQIGLCKSTIQIILHNQLGPSKLFARWILRIRSAQQKANRLETILNLLDRLKDDPADFCRRLVTGEVIWPHPYDLDSKHESMACHAKGTPHSNPSYRGRLFNTYGIAVDLCYFIIYSQADNQHAIFRWNNGQVAASHPVKSVGFCQEGFAPPCLHSNASANSAVAKAAIHVCGFEQLPHPPYLPCDFHLSQIWRSICARLDLPETKISRWQLRVVERAAQILLLKGNWSAESHMEQMLWEQWRLYWKNWAE